MYDTATTQIYPYSTPLSLHDALPICTSSGCFPIPPCRTIATMRSATGRPRSKTRYKVLKAAHDREIGEPDHRSFARPQPQPAERRTGGLAHQLDRKSTRLNSSH